MALQSSLKVSWLTVLPAADLKRVDEIGFGKFENMVKKVEKVEKVKMRLLLLFLFLDIISIKIPGKNYHAN